MDPGRHPFPRPWMGPSYSPLPPATHHISGTPSPGHPFLFLMFFLSNWSRHPCVCHTSFTSSPGAPTGHTRLLEKRSSGAGRAQIIWGNQWFWLWRFQPCASLGSHSLLVCFANSIRFYLEPSRKRLGLLGRQGWDLRGDAMAAEEESRHQQPPK